MKHHRRTFLTAFFLTIVFVLEGCGAVPIPFVGGGAPTPSRQISYDGLITLTGKTGENVAGTAIRYDGKAPDGRAIVNIGGLQGLKSTADSVNWSGALVLFSKVDLNLRVLTYDANGITLAGTIHVIVQEPQPTAGNISTNQIASFVIPSTMTVNRNTTIPGTTVSYVGAQTQGAEFANLDQLPFRDRGDSVVWTGHLRDRIGIRVELRVIDFNADRVILGGTVTVIFES